MIFDNPNFLWALWLVLLPVIIHLFNFKRFKKVYFSNLRFLKTVEQQTKRHSQMRHLLVLLSRILFVIFLVLAFAKPILPKSDKKQDASAQKRVAVYVDNSFSMQQKGKRGELLEEGRKVAKDIVKSYRSTDKFMFVTNDIQTYETSFLSRDDYMSDLRDCEFQPYSLPISNVISELTSQANSTSEKPTDLFVVSDFQKTTTDVSNWKLDSNVNLHLVPLSSSSANNIYVDSSWLSEPITFQDKPIKIYFSLAKNFDEAAENVMVKLIVNGVQKGVQTLDFTKNKQNIAFLFKPDSSKYQSGYLEIDDYPIAFDNRFYFSFALRKSYVITMVNGDNEANFIQKFYGSDSTFLLYTFDQSQIDYSSFSGSDVLILNGLTSFSSGMLEEVKKYVENGGRMVFIPASTTSPDEINVFNQYFNLPNVVGVDTSKIQVTDLVLQNVLFKNVFNLKHNILPDNIDLPFFKYRFKIKWPIKSNDKSIMIFGDGNPLLVSSKKGLGNLYYFTASVDKMNSNLGRHALFIPLFYNFAYLLNSDAVLYYLIGKEKIALRNLPAQKESPFHIIGNKDNFDFIPGQRGMNGEITFFLEGNIQVSGNYYLSQQGEKYAPLSFNYAAQESNLDNYSYSELKDLTKKYNLINTEIIDNQSVSFGDGLVVVDNGLQLWKIFILMAIMFLLIEVFLLRFLK